MKIPLSFYRGKRVFVTGHTGFKGTWLSLILQAAGAQVTGYSLDPPTTPSMFALTDAAVGMTSVQGDVRDFDHLLQTLQQSGAEIVFHLAAQPLVRESYRDPVGTYGTNVMGTVHLLEAVRRTETVRSIVNVTTDKVYDNPEDGQARCEQDRLDGYDPYSNSKSCSELVSATYRRCFFQSGPALSCLRAGNVIGGGDFSADRIIPDCVRAAMRGTPIVVRNPSSVRPYQHVLEPLGAYLMTAAAQWETPELAGCYNIGPEPDDCRHTGELVDLFIRFWGAGAGREDRPDGGPHEAGFLQLDSARLKTAFGWSPRWDVTMAMQKTVEWYQAFRDGQDLHSVTKAQIRSYFRAEEMG